MNSITKILRPDRGEDMVEYGLLAVFISICAVTTLRLLGPIVLAIWDNILAALP